jgi:hypothetical protein
VKEEEIEHTFLLGGLVPIGESPPSVTPAEEDEVEFVSPRIPGRMRRGLQSRPTRRTTSPMPDTFKPVPPDHPMFSTGP